MVSQVYGNILVESDIADSQGPISSLEHTATDGIHLVKVENLSTIPYDVRVSVELPQGTARLAFIVAGSTEDSWKAEAWSLAGSDSENLDCQLDCRANGPASERIHCIAVRWRKPKRHRWHSATKDLPLSLIVQIV